MSLQLCTYHQLAHILFIFLPMPDGADTYNLRFNQCLTFINAIPHMGAAIDGVNFNHYCLAHTFQVHPHGGTLALRGFLV